MSRVDVAVAGADLCGISVAMLFKRSGFEVVLIDEARRLGGSHCYLPLTSNSLRFLGAVMDEAYIAGVVKDLELLLRVGERDLHKPLRADICVVDVSPLCERLAGGEDIPVLLWSKVIGLEEREGGVRIGMETPRGRGAVEATLLIDTRTRPGGMGALVTTCASNAGPERSHALISGGLVELSLSHGSLATLVSTNREAGAESRIALSEVQLEVVQTRRSLNTIVAGEPAGHAATLWIGDALVSSASIAQRLGATYLEGAEDRRILERYIDLQRLAERGRMIIESALAGSIHELPLSFVERALNPSIYHELLW